MTKREIARVTLGRIIDHIIGNYGGEGFDDEGARITFTIGEFQGQIQRGSFDVALWDALPMGGGFEQEDYDHHYKAVELENKLNKELQEIVAAVVENTK